MFSFLWETSQVKNIDYLLMNSKHIKLFYNLLINVVLLLNLTGSFLRHNLDAQKEVGFAKSAGDK